MGDIFGFAHTTLTSSPAQGDAAPFGSANNVDDADNVIAIVGSPDSSSGTYYGVYSTNDGATFQYFATSPGTGDSYGTDTVAVSANGSTIVWAQSGLAPYYTTNDGTTWIASSGGMAANGQIIADRLNADDFYYHVGSDVYFSSNGGVSFTLETSSAPSGGDMVVNPFVTGDLWIANSSGLFHSSNFGDSFSQVSSSLTSTDSVIALGRPAPGQTVPAIYVFGTISNFLGIYRSDDGGSTWTQLNNTSEQWGGLIQTMAADPNVFGRLYIGINGRGIIMGNPATSLPANWVDTDINTPGNPGWATSSTTLSNGTTVNQWILDGGGEGLTGNSMSITSLTYTDPTTGQFYVTAVTAAPNGLTVGDTVTIAGASPAGFDGTFQVAGIVNSTTFTYFVVPGASSATGTITATTHDQFNFAYEPISGDVTDSAELLSLTNADDGNGTPEAGVMIRAGTDDDDPFVAMVQTAGDDLIFEYRTTTGGSVSSVSLGSVPVGSEYVEIVRNGNNFSGYYSSDGVTWTQLGSTIAIAAMPSTANVGLAATANYNSQLTSATFSNLNVSNGPSVTNPAAADPNPVTGTTTALSALGSENGSGAGLNYTWSATSVPNGVNAPTYSVNGTNAAANTTATFYGAGSYSFLVTISDASNNSVTSSVNVTVEQTPTGVIVSPSSATVATGGTQQFSATATDQFNNPISSPTFTWSITGTSDGNSIDGTGLATLGSTPGTFTVMATLGSASNTAQVSADVAPTVSSFQVNDGNAQRSMVDSLTVTFNESVTLADNAITLNLLSQTGGSPTPMSFTLSGSGTTYVLTFTGSDDVGNSLPDGAYELIVSAGGVSGTGNLNMSADQDYEFFRLYGDFNGDGKVDSADFGVLAIDYGTETNSSDWYLDYNGDGVIDSADFGAFAVRYGESISIPSDPSVTLLAAATTVPATPPPATSTATGTSATKELLTTTTTTTPPAPAVQSAKPLSKKKPWYEHGH